MNIKQTSAVICGLIASMLVAGCGPGQMLGPTLTPSPTNKPTQTNAPTPTDTPTSTPTNIPTLTPTPHPLAGIDPETIVMQSGDTTSDYQKTKSEPSNPHENTEYRLINGLTVTYARSTATQIDAYVSSIFIFEDETVAAAFFQNKSKETLASIQEYKDAGMGAYAMEIPGIGDEHLAAYFGQVTMTNLKGSGVFWRYGEACGSLEYVGTRWPNEMMTIANQIHNRLAAAMNSLDREPENDASRASDTSSTPSKVTAQLLIAHEPNPATFQVGGASGAAYTCSYKTSVKAVGIGVRIEVFGMMFWKDEQWSPSSTTFGPEDFSEWYSCPDAYVKPGQECADPNNWNGQDLLEYVKGKWYYEGIDDNGNRVRGEAVIECLP